MIEPGAAPAADRAGQGSALSDEQTGHLLTDLNDAAAELERLSDRSPAEQIDAFSELHRRLVDALATYQIGPTPNAPRP